MTDTLRRAMAEAAEHTPPLAVPAGLFDRARRNRRRRQVLAVAVGVLLVAAGFVLRPAVPQTIVPAAPPDNFVLPATVVVPPDRTADVRDAPLSRALVLYQRDNLPGGFNPIALIGPDDRYRVYDLPDTGPLLSPDGRYVLMSHYPESDDVVQETRVFDVATGATRVLTGGTPLGWSMDGRRAILVETTNTPDDRVTAVTIRVIRLSDGRVERQITVPTRPDTQDSKDVAAALSPDGTSIAIQHGPTLSVYHQDGSHTDMTDGNSTLAGPAAWSPDATELLVQTLPTGLEALDARTGATVTRRGFPKLPPYRVDGNTFAPESVVAWIGQDPVVTVGNEVVRLGPTARVLVQAPGQADDLQIATLGVDIPPRRPGPIDPGPPAPRHWPPSVLVVIIVMAAVIAATIIRRRRSNAKIRTRFAGTGSPLGG